MFDELEKIMIVLIGIAVVFTLVSMAVPGLIKIPGINTPGLNMPELQEQSKLKKFTSYDELSGFLKANSQSGGYGEAMLGRDMAGVTTSGAVAAQSESKSAPSSASSDDYSTTNIQVAGVDEADIVKNDGKYIYTLSGNAWGNGNSVIIVDAYPADELQILSVINASSKENFRDMYINGDRLTILGQKYEERDCAYPADNDVETQKTAGCGATGCIIPPQPSCYSTQITFIKVYDVADRSEPKLVRESDIDGYYLESRMIGDYVYAIVNQPTYYRDPVPLPWIATTTKEGSSSKEVQATDVYYFDYPDYSYQFTTIAALNTKDDSEKIKTKVIMMGSTEQMYVSQDNIYVTYTKRVSRTYETDRMIDDVYIALAPSDIASQMRDAKESNLTKYEKYQKIAVLWQEYMNSLTGDEKEEVQKNMQEKISDIQADIAKETEKTVVHRIEISNGQVNHKATGEFPGHLLNQFSMDESEGHFRVATTTGQNWWGWGGMGFRRTGESTLRNNIYVMNSDLEVVGKLEDLAKGESIYSARFIGDRVYLVTFKKIDPLFVIDLSDPANPQVLGQLKIPGYSDYLHPYDENHVIGIGKEAVAAESPDGTPTNFAWYQGVKLSLFDVSDVEHPKEISKYNIGDRGTDSNALYDHKAFLFSKQKGIIVIPITLAEIDESKYPGGVEPNTYGDFVWQGAYVLNIDLENGITLRDRVTHVSDESEFKKAGYYYYNDATSVKRSLYIGNALYTISNKIIKANDLTSLEEINKLMLPYKEQYEGPIYY